MPNTPKKESERAAAARLSVAFNAIVTRSQVQYWRAQGYDLNDIKSLTHSLRNQERIPETLKFVLAPQGATPAPPPPQSSRGSLPVEYVWEREMNLLFKLADWLPEFCVGKSESEIQKVVFTAACLRAKEWDEILGNIDEFGKRLAEFKQFLNDRPPLTDDGS